MPDRYASVMMTETEQFGIRPRRASSSSPITGREKSVAFRLTFRLPDKNLSDEEVDRAIAKILKKLSEEAGITLRS